MKLFMKGNTRENQYKERKCMLLAYICRYTCHRKCMYIQVKLGFGL